MDGKKPGADLLTPQEAALELRLSKDVVYSMAESGEIDHFRIRGRIFIPREAIQKLLNAHFHPARRSFFHRKSPYRNQATSRVS